MTVSITIDGLDELQKKLGTKFKPVMRSVTKAVAMDIKGRMTPYPHETIANSPTQPRWYERGHGPRWRRRDGTIGGKKTSQMLGKSWTVGKAGSIGAKVGTRVTYAPFVQSDEKQSRIHKQIGWKTDKEAVDECVKDGAVNRITSQAVKKAMGI